MTEQTEIAKTLGISMNALHKILQAANIEKEPHFKLINNKRHYNIEEILQVIKKGQKNG